MTVFYLTYVGDHQVIELKQIQEGHEELFFTV